MSSITPSSSLEKSYTSPSISFEILKEKDFFSKFNENETCWVRRGEKIASSERSITSISIRDSITVFALKYLQVNKKEIIGWHFSQDASLEKIKQQFTELSSSKEDYILYLVGGNSCTNDPLNQRIEKAIDACFSEKTSVCDEWLGYLQARKSKHPFISVNVQMDGKVILCEHDRT